MKTFKKGECYKHNKLEVYKKITNADERICIHLCLRENSVNYAKEAIFHRVHEDEFVLIDNKIFDEKMKVFLEIAKEY